jgi:hypothetical protein
MFVPQRTTHRMAEQCSWHKKYEKIHHIYQHQTMSFFVLVSHAVLWIKVHNESMDLYHRAATDRCGALIVAVPYVHRRQFYLTIMRMLHELGEMSLLFELISFVR